MDTMFLERIMSTMSLYKSEFAIKHHVRGSLWLKYAFKHALMNAFSLVISMNITNVDR